MGWYKFNEGWYELRVMKVSVVIMQVETRQLNLIKYFKDLTPVDKVILSYI